jgi:cytochrome c556
MRSHLFLPAAVLALALAACSQEAAPSAPQAAAQPQEPLFQITATIQDIMDSEVDPAADALWATTGFVADKTGLHDKTPHTDAEWTAARHNALILIEATNLLRMEGRKVADRELDKEEKGGVEDPAVIQKNIEANRAAFIGFARRLHDVGSSMLQAIDKRDVAGMDKAGEELDAACEACHRTFWYPNAVEPIQTLEPPK